MRESFLKTLMYLFDNFVEGKVGFQSKPENIVLEMIRAGYEPKHIKSAIGWFVTLDKAMFDLSKSLDVLGFPENSIRIYAEKEIQKISVKARSYIRDLEQLGIIDAPVRELIIHCATCFGSSHISLQEIQCISLLVLYRQPKKREQLRMLEYLTLHEEYEEIKH